MTSKKVKYIGFEIKDSLKRIYLVMLRSIVDFTIPKSSCHIYY